MRYCCLMTKNSIYPLCSADFMNHLGLRNLKHNKRVVCNLMADSQLGPLKGNQKFKQPEHSITCNAPVSLNTEACVPPPTHQNLTNVTMHCLNLVGECSGLYHPPLLADGALFSPHISANGTLSADNVTPNGISMVN